LIAVVRAILRFRKVGRGKTEKIVFFLLNKEKILVGELKDFYPWDLIENAI